MTMSDNYQQQLPLPGNDASGSRAVIWSLVIAASLVVDVAVLLGVAALWERLLEIPELRQLAPIVVSVLLATTVVVSSTRRAWRNFASRD
jgi:hypothetical protein